MKNKDFNTVNVTDGTEMEIFATFPEGTGKFPAIIVIQEAFGVTQHIRNICEKYCREGYAVVSPDIFHRTVRRLEASYDDFPSVMPHYQALSNESLTYDLNAVYDFLKQQHNVEIEKIGAVGFCLGGRVSFLANAVLPLSAAVSYYGGGLEQLANEAKSLHGAHLFYWGGLDKHITQEKIDIIINAVKEANKDFTSVMFSLANHAFNNDERHSYNPLAAKEAWAHTLSFFENRLR